MAEIIVRNLDPAVVRKFDELARAKNLSREEYLRRYLGRVAFQGDVELAEEKYMNLVKAVAELVEHTNDIIAYNSEILDDAKRQLEAYALGVTNDP